MQIELGQKLLPSTLVIGNTIDISGLSISPDFMFFSWLMASAEGGPTSNSARFGFGFTGGTSLDGHIAGARRQGEDPYGTQSAIRTDSCISAMSASGAYAMSGAVKFNTWIDGGVRLECISNFSQDLLVEFMAISGIGAFDVHTLTEPASAGEQVKSGLGFAPGSLFCLGTSMSAINSGGAHWLLSIGCATGIESTEQAVLSGIERSSLGSGDLTSYNRGGEVICLYPTGTSNPTPDARASVSNLAADGYTLTWSERAASRTILVLALQASLELGTLLTRTDTNPFTEAYTSAPAGILFFSNTEAETPQDTGPTGGNCPYSIGAATDPSNGWCVATRGNGDGATLGSIIGLFIRSRSVYFNFNASDTADGEMDIDADGLGASEMALIMDDADPSQAFVWYVIFPSVALDVRPRLLRYHENAHVSRMLGRTVILDPFGREIPPNELQVDEWIRSDGAFMPTSRKFSSLALDPAAGYIEAVDERRAQLRITVVREGLFESVMRRLGRGG